jgi:Acetyltransferase (GNAT) domain
MYVHPMLFVKVIELMTVVCVAEIWLRSLVHYIFLDDARGERVVGEPDAGNTAIRKAADSAGFHNTLVSPFCSPWYRGVADGGLGV